MFQPTGDIRKRVEKALGSVGRIRILPALADPESPALSKYQLERRTGLRSRSLAADLNTLIEMGWVIEVGESEGAGCTGFLEGTSS